MDVLVLALSIRNRETASASPDGVLLLSFCAGTRKNRLLVINSLEMPICMESCMAKLQSESSHPTRHSLLSNLNL